MNLNQITIRSTKVGDAIEFYQKLGLEFEIDPIDQSWLWRESYLRDPDGNKICLYYAGENRLNPPWRVKS